MNELFNVLTNNIWFIVLLSAMFIRRPYRISAMIILTSKVAFGVTPSWLIVTLVIISILMDIEQYSRSYATTRNREKKVHNN